MPGGAEGSPEQGVSGCPPAPGPSVSERAAAAAHTWDLGGHTPEERPYLLTEDEHRGVGRDAVSRASAPQGWGRQAASAPPGLPLPVQRFGRRGPRAGRVTPRGRRGWVLRVRPQHRSLCRDHWPGLDTLRAGGQAWRGVVRVSGRGRLGPVAHFLLSPGQGECGPPPGRLCP